MNRATEKIRMEVSGELARIDVERELAAGTRHGRNAARAGKDVPEEMFERAAAGEDYAVAWLDSYYDYLEG